MSTSKENLGRRDNANHNKKYKIYFLASLIINILLVAYILWTNNKAQFIPSGQMTTTNEKNELQKNFDTAISRLDSVTGANEQLMRELGKPSAKDTTKLTPEEKRLIRLVDSTFMVKDSINKVIAFMNDSIELQSLSREQLNNYSHTINLLGIIKIKMDLTLDNLRIQYLKGDRTQLEAVISKYDTKKEKLGKLANRLKFLSNFLKITIDVLSAAASHGIIVTPSKT
jgi:hypothetical protein